MQGKHFSLRLCLVPHDIGNQASTLALPYERHTSVGGLVSLGLCWCMEGHIIQRRRQGVGLPKLGSISSRSFAVYLLIGHNNTSAFRYHYRLLSPGHEWHYQRRRNGKSEYRPSSALGFENIEASHLPRSLCSSFFASPSPDRRTSLNVPSRPSETFFSRIRTERYFLAEEFHLALLSTARQVKT